MYYAGKSLITLFAVLNHFGNRLVLGDGPEGLDESSNSRGIFSSHLRDVDVEANEAYESICVIDKGNGRRLDLPSVFQRQSVAYEGLASTPFGLAGIRKKLWV